jgi:hypothetical protein
MLIIFVSSIFCDDFLTIMHFISNFDVGFCKNQVTISQGSRLHTASAYIRHCMKRKNLHISLYTHVIRVSILLAPDIVYKSIWHWLNQHVPNIIQ